MRNEYLRIARKHIKQLAKRSRRAETMDEAIQYSRQLVSATKLAAELEMNGGNRNGNSYVEYDVT